MTLWDLTGSMSPQSGFYAHLGQAIGPLVADRGSNPLPTPSRPLGVRLKSASGLTARSSSGG